MLIMPSMVIATMAVLGTAFVGLGIANSPIKVDSGMQTKMVGVGIAALSWATVMALTEMMPS